MTDPSSSSSARPSGEGRKPTSPARLLELLHDRYGLLCALAHASLKLAEQDDPECYPPMDEMTAWGVLAIGNDLREVRDAAVEWMMLHTSE